MYLNIVFLPFLAFLAVIFFGALIGKRGAVLITATSMVLCVLLSFYGFYEVALSRSTCYVPVFNWINSDLFELRWGFLFDTLTMSMLLLVTVVSFLVHLFSSVYMGGDPHLARFMSYLSLFTFFMIILVSGDNLVQVFVGWEGVGLCSFLLINFWSSRLQANKSAIKAMVVNRIGDYGLCLGLFLIYLLTGTLEFSSLFASSIYWVSDTFSLLGCETDVYTAVCFLLCLGVIGKSAQLGLHTWLPDAMEGPTPVSALIHAATMVTAGIFLVLRCSMLFEMTTTALLLLTFVGSMTAFFAATTGVFQNDLKKVIAYSTCSQLGYMAFACGISMYSVSFFHLFNHGFFKALLFLSAGSIIHAVQDEQDMRKMGGLLQLLPFSYSMILIGSFSLMGVPFLTGFYSKDLVLECAYSSYFISSHFAFWLGSVSAFLTAFYSIRLVYLTFYTRPNGFKASFLEVHEAPSAMAIPLMVLATASIFLGYLGKDLFVGPGSTFWGNSFFLMPQSLDSMDAEFIPHYIKLLPVVLSLTGGSMSFIVNSFLQEVLWRLTSSTIGKSTYSFFNQKWLFDVVYHHTLAFPVLKFGGNTTFQLIDKGFVELFGPYGLIRLVRILSKSASHLQTGWIHHSVFIMLAGIVLYIFFFSFSVNISYLLPIKYFYLSTVLFLYIALI